MSMTLKESWAHGRNVAWPGASALGWYSDVTTVHKFGFSDVVSTTEIPLWDGDALYTYQSSEAVVKVSSTDDTNDKAGGTGALTVKVYGLDESLAEVSETVTLTGQTAAVTTQAFYRVFRARVLTAGSGGANVGTIWIGTGTVTGGVPATKYAAISPTRNQTLMAMYTVPAGKRFVLTQIFMTTGGSATAVVTARLAVNPRSAIEGSVFQTKDQFVFVRGANIDEHYNSPSVYAAGTDIQLRASASVSTDVSGSFDGWLVDA